MQEVMADFQDEEALAPSTEPSHSRTSDHDDLRPAACASATLDSLAREEMSAQEVLPVLVDDDDEVMSASDEDDLPSLNGPPDEDGAECEEVQEDDDDDELPPIQENGPPKDTISLSITPGRLPVPLLSPVVGAAPEESMAARMREKMQARREAIEGKDDAHEVAAVADQQLTIESEEQMPKDETKVSIEVESDVIADRTSLNISGMKELTEAAIDKVQQQELDERCMLKPTDEAEEQHEASSTTRSSAPLESERVDEDTPRPESDDDEMSTNGAERTPGIGAPLLPRQLDVDMKREQEDNMDEENMPSERNSGKPVMEDEEESAGREMPPILNILNSGKPREEDGQGSESSMRPTREDEARDMPPIRENSKPVEVNGEGDMLPIREKGKPLKEDGEDSEGSDMPPIRENGGTLREDSEGRDTPPIRENGGPLKEDGEDSEVCDTPPIRENSKPVEIDGEGDMLPSRENGMPLKEEEEDTEGSDMPPIAFRQNDRPVKKEREDSKGSDMPHITETCKPLKEDDESSEGSMPSLEQDLQDEGRKNTDEDDDDGMPPILQQSPPLKDNSNKANLTMIHEDEALEGDDSPMSTLDDDDCGYCPVDRKFFPEEFQIAEMNLVNSEVSGNARQQADAKLVLADLNFDCAKFAEARKLADEALKLYHDSDDGDSVSEVAKAVRLLVRIDVAEEKGEAAMKLAREQLACFEKAESVKAVAIMNLAIVDLQMEQERPKEAIKLATAALESFRKLEDNQGIVKALQSVARVSVALAKPDTVEKAHKLLDEAKELCAADRDVEEEACVNLEKTRAHLARGEFQQAFDLSQAIGETVRDEGCRKMEAAALKQTSIICLEFKSAEDIAFAGELINCSIEAYGQVGDPVGEFGARLAAADVYAMLGKGPEAREMLEESVALARDLKDRRLIRKAMEQLVNFLWATGAVEDANRALRQELQLASRSKDSRRHLSSFQALVGLLGAAGQTEEATNLAQKCFKTLSYDPDRKVGAWCHQLVAEVHQTNGNIEDCLNEAQEGLTILRATGDVRAAAGVIELIFNANVERGEDQVALQAIHVEREIFTEAGWSEEAIEVVMKLVQLNSSLHEWKEAVRLGRLAQNLRKALGDTPGEAEVLLVLSTCQSEAKLPTEALKSTVLAKSMFKLVEDTSGEARALRAAADIYLSNGSVEEAIRVTDQARQICEKAEDFDGTAMAIQKLANMRITQIEKDPDGVREMKPQLFKDAVDTIQNFLNIARAKEDYVGCFHGVLQLGRLHIMNKDGANAIETGNDAVQLATRVDEEQNPNAMAMALLLLGEGQLLSGNRDEALRNAQEALQDSEDMGDQERIQAAKKLMSDARMPPQAKAPMKATPKRFGDAKAPGVFMPPGRAGAFSSTAVAEDPMQRELRPPSNNLPQWRQKNQAECDNDQETDRPAGRPARRGFSAMAETLHNPAPPREAPNQELRRQQMIDSMNAKASAASSNSNPHAAQIAQNPMWSMLNMVRPGWSISELRIIQEKLQAIDILTVPDLYELLKNNSAEDINRKFKEVGKRPMKVDTLESMLTHARSVDELN